MNTDPDFQKLEEQTSRYSIEVNYRTTKQEILDGFAKLTLGYVSAAMKNCGYHTRVMFDEKPYRVVVSSRSWDDGEWVAILLYNASLDSFVIGSGHYNKDKKTVSIQHHRKCEGDSGSDLARELRNLMERLKKQPARTEIEPAALKRGPKPTHLKKLKKIPNPWKSKSKF